MNGFVCEYMCHPKKYSKKAFSTLHKIVAYPQSNIDEILSVMEDAKIDYIPVIKSPWCKKIIGFLKKNELKTKNFNA